MNPIDEAFDRLMIVAEATFGVVSPLAMTEVRAAIDNLLTTVIEHSDEPPMVLIARAAQHLSNNMTDDPEGNSVLLLELVWFVGAASVSDDFVAGLEVAAK